MIAHVNDEGDDDETAPLNPGSDSGPGGESAHGLLDRAIAVVDYPHWAGVVLTSIGTFIDAAEVVSIMLLLPVFQKEFNASLNDLAAISSCTAGGMMVGGIVFGIVSDRYGRRVVYLVSMTMVIAFGLLSSFATSLGGFAAVRFFLGTAYGGNSVSGVTVILEALPPARRSVAMALHSMSWGLGAMFASALGAALPTIGWQWYLRIPCLLAAPVWCLIFIYVRESARWYVFHGRFQDAVDSVRANAEAMGVAPPPFFTVAQLDACVVPPVHGWFEIPAKLRSWHAAAHLLPLVAVWFIFAWSSSILVWVPLQAEALAASSNATTEVFVPAISLSSGSFAACVLLLFIAPRLHRTTLLAVVRLRAFFVRWFFAHTTTRRDWQCHRCASSCWAPSPASTPSSRRVSSWRSLTKWPRACCGSSRLKARRPPCAPPCLASASPSPGSRPRACIVLPYG